MNVLPNGFEQSRGVIMGIETPGTGHAHGDAIRRAKLT
jgi:hypothetical protein